MKKCDGCENPATEVINKECGIRIYCEQCARRIKEEAYFRNFQVEIAAAAGKLREKCWGIVKEKADTIFRKCPAISSFSFEQSLFGPPENRSAVERGLTVNGQWANSDFLEKEKQSLLDQYPLLKEVIDSDYTNARDAIEELLDFFKFFCSPQVCRLFGNRFGVQANRKSTEFYEIKT
jgi:hypothetical protein